MSEWKEMVKTYYCCQAFINHIARGNIHLDIDKKLTLMDNDLVKFCPFCGVERNGAEKLR